MQKDGNSPSADAILRWIPAFAGMTSRIRHLAKVLQKVLTKLQAFSFCPLSKLPQN